MIRVVHIQQLLIEHLLCARVQWKYTGPVLANLELMLDGCGKQSIRHLKPVHRLR